MPADHPCRRLRRTPPLPSPVPLGHPRADPFPAGSGAPLAFAGHQTVVGASTTSLASPPPPHRTTPSLGILGNAGEPLGSGLSPSSHFPPLQRTSSAIHKRVVDLKRLLRHNKI
ncbi:hypothetical protein ZWY2020_034617 [Hordeum vulgare]|nr:hypothetical protein ZWY2020_034617 [Hordeum vulgare]